MPRVHRYGYEGPEFIDINNKGVIDSKARKAFMHGQCHSLALAIRELTGWPLFGFVDRADGDRPSSPGHIAVWVPELEDYVDIGGRQALARWLEVFPSAEVHRVFPSTIRRGMSMYLPLNVEAAMPYAKTVLRKYCGKVV